MKKNVIVCVAAVLILISGGIYIYYGYLFKASRKIYSEAPVFQISAERLVQEYNTNPQKADSLYLNKTIEIEGIATKVIDSVIQMEKGIFCLFEKKAQSDLLGKKVIVKGKCIGYDELFQEVKLDQCTINK